MKMKKLSVEKPVRIALKTITGFCYFEYDDVILFRANGHNTECLTVSDKVSIRVLHSLKHIERQYCYKYFKRCSKSAIVNIKHIRNLEIKTKQLFLTNDIAIKVSDDFKKYLKYLDSDETTPDYAKNIRIEKKTQILKRLRIIINKLRVSRIGLIFKKIKILRHFLRGGILFSLLFLIYRCESTEKFLRPNLPEKLCSIGIIDVDDTTLRHISFERSFQAEYPEEYKDSLRDFSFSISSSTGELFNFHCDSTVKNIKDLRIPDDILFNPGVKYYLYAKERNLEWINAEVISTATPPKPKIISTEAFSTNLAKPAGCSNILDVGTLLINIEIDKKDNMYYAFLVKGWGFTHSSFWPYTQIPLFLDFSVVEGNTPGFLTVMQGLTTHHYWQCENNIYGFEKKDPTYAYFIDGNKIPNSGSQLTLSVQYRDGYCLYEAIQGIGIKIISIPRELFLFEKNIYLYRETSGDPFAEPVYFNGNINGGHGVFAICRSSEVKISFSHWL
jgi:hypothetical protein